MVESEVNRQGIWDGLNYEAHGSMSTMVHCIEELRDPNKVVLFSAQDRAIDHCRNVGTQLKIGTT
eukprot:4965925-Karenia_brevis.AAC.1